MQLAAIHKAEQMLGCSLAFLHLPQHKGVFPEGAPLLRGLLSLPALDGACSLPEAHPRGPGQTGSGTCGVALPRSRVHWDGSGAVQNGRPI